MRCYEHTFLRRNWIQAQFLVSSTAPWPFLEEQILSRSPMPYKSCIDENNLYLLTSSTIFNKIWPLRTNHTGSPYQNSRVQAGGLITRVESLKSEVWSLKSEVWSLKSEIRSLKSEVWSLKSLLGFRSFPFGDSRATNVTAVNTQCRIGLRNKGIPTSWKILDHGYLDVWYKLYL